MGAAISAEVARGKAAGFHVAKQEITGKDGGAIEVADLSSRTTEELIAIVEAGTGTTSS